MKQVDPETETSARATLPRQERKPGQVVPWLGDSLTNALRSAFSLTSFLLICLTFLAYLVTFAREIVLAAAFGTSLELDLFLVAFALPLLVANMPLHVLDATLVPPYLARREADTEDADRLASAILNFTFLALAVSAVVFLALSGAIFPALFPGYDPGRMARALYLFWWLSPFVLLAGTSNALQPLLNSRRLFHVAPLGQVANGVTVVLCVLVLAPGLGIMSLACGVLLGAFFSLAVHLLGLRRLAFKYRLIWDYRREESRLVGTLALPLLGGALLSQALVLVSRILGSYLPAGSIAALNYAFVLVQTLVVIFAVSLSTIMYPQLTSEVAKKDGQHFRRLFHEGLVQQVLFLVPLTGLLWLSSWTIIEIVFQRGSFDAAATKMTASALAFYSLSLVPWGVSHFCTKVLYSLRRISPVILFHAANFAGALCFGWLLIGRYGHLGIALGTSISFILNTVLLLIWSERQVSAWASASGSTVSMRS